MGMWCQKTPWRSRLPNSKETTRSTTSMLACPIKGDHRHFASNAVSVWNNFESLRSARTLAAARGVARTMAAVP
ncbi:Hypothetical protein FKW44_007553 [Caligus rogercresseyi]|uniref:Uncharacterized protein n=1 Tax=Caligus rogercresseyi TaxID=217165 RepID=A0A7T8KF81_CALRO|nr:Hypothetical protein FKW44_007553 [Caligus rogercresseyi]